MASRAESITQQLRPDTLVKSGAMSLAVLCPRSETALGGLDTVGFRDCRGQDGFIV